MTLMKNARVKIQLTFCNKNQYIKSKQQPKTVIESQIKSQDLSFVNGSYDISRENYTSEAN